MFVTNWLTWNTVMMQANCSTPSSRMSGPVFTFFFSFFPHSASVATALWAVAQQTKLGKWQARFNQLWTEDSSHPSRPAGHSVQLSPVPLSTCHVTSNHLVQAWEVLCRGKTSSYWPSVAWSYALASWPVWPGEWQYCDTHAACIKPSLCLRIPGVIMSYDVPVGWK